MIESIEQGRKEDGNRSIANKIKSRLHDLEKTVESNYGRWAWELLQNAKDSISNDESRKVSVLIEIDADSVTFKHNGLYFTDLDIRGLINQISSKEVEEGVETKNTGRFGTGFLTTHLLSKKVEILGVVKANEGFHDFSFLLDRDGSTTEILAKKVEESWKGFQDSAKPLDIEYDDKTFNTSFKYLLESENQKSVAKRGITEFLQLIPFVLAFIPKIQEITITDNTSNEMIKFENTDEVIDDILIKIKKTINEESSDTLIAIEKNDRVSIATEIEKHNGKYLVKGVEDIPKIFCDFPLIGTEKFHFPVVVNSFYFSPQTERDGIWLKGSEDEEVATNYELLQSSVELYKTLLEKIANNNYTDLYNIANTKIPNTDERYFDKDWYIENIQKPLREVLMQSEIVETSSGRVKLENVYFPDKDLLKEAREKIWQFSSNLKVNKLPIKEHIQKWAEVIWSECKKVDIDDLVNDLKGKKNIAELEKILSIGKTETFEWLKQCLTFIKENDEYNYPKYEIIPNQEGTFKSHNSLKLDEIDDEELKQIAKLVGFNYYEILIHQDLFYDFEISKIDIEMIANKITTLINEESDSEDRKKAITMLIEWFGNNEEKGKEYFSSLYSKKEKLLVDTIEDKESLYSILRSDVKIADIAEMIRQDPAKVRKSMQKAKELDALYEEFGVTTIDELKKLITTSPKGNIAIENINESIIPIDVPKKATSEVLASLGITNASDFEIAKKSHPELFHENVPTKEMYDVAQSLITRAMKNIEEHLKTLNDEYNCEDIEATAPTVLGGIVKHGRDISVVARPSDSGKIVIGYYESEIPTLELDTSELWYENGTPYPQRMTLGKMLKSTNITRIPV